MVKDVKGLKTDRRQLHLGSSASSARFGGVETPYDWDTPRRSILCLFSFFLSWLAFDVT